MSGDVLVLTEREMRLVALLEAMPEDEKGRLDRRYLDDPDVERFWLERQGQKFFSVTAAGLAHTIGQPRRFVHRAARTAEMHGLAPSCGVIEGKQLAAARDSTAPKLPPKTYGVSSQARSVMFVGPNTSLLAAMRGRTPAAQQLRDVLTSMAEARFAERRLESAVRWAALAGYAGASVRSRIEMLRRALAEVTEQRSSWLDGAVDLWGASQALRCDPEVQEWCEAAGQPLPTKKCLEKIAYALDLRRTVDGVTELQSFATDTNSDGKLDKYDQVLRLHPEGYRRMRVALLYGLRAQARSAGTGLLMSATA